MIAPLRWLSGAMAAVLVLMVCVYRLTLRPLLGGQCRFTPSCSEYFIQAVRLRGPVVGLALGVWRICRCNPLGKSGYDPVPERRDAENSKSEIRNPKQITNGKS